MTKYFDSITKKLMPLLAAGMLLQTGGCTFDAREEMTSLITLMAGQLISGAVSGVFSLA